MGKPRFSHLAIGRTHSVSQSVEAMGIEPANLLHAMHK